MHLTRKSFIGIAASFASMLPFSRGQAATTQKPQRFSDASPSDADVVDITDCDTYLRRKFRQDVTDLTTGMGSAELERHLFRLCSAAKVSGEPWRITKAKCFAFQLEHQAVDVSPLDWFPAIAVWNSSQIPMQKILRHRASEVKYAFVPPDVLRQLEEGNSDGTWFVHQDFGQAAPDWRDALKLGFPGLKRRVQQLSIEGDPFFSSLAISSDAILKAIDRFIAQGRRRLAANANSYRLGKELAALNRLKNGAPQTAYDALMFIWLVFFHSEHLDAINCSSLCGLDAALAPFYAADLVAGRTTEREFREQFRHFLWQWAAFDECRSISIGLGGTGANGESLYNDLSRVILEVADECDLPNPKLLAKISSNTPAWAFGKMLEMARRRRPVVFIGEETAAKALKKWSGAGADECRDMIVKGECEFALHDGANDTAAGYLNLLKPIGVMLDAARKGKLLAAEWNDFLAQYNRRIASSAIRCREVAFELEKTLAQINPANCMTLANRFALENRRDGFADGCRRGNNTSILAVGLGSAVDALLAVKELVYETREFTLASLGEIMASNWKGHDTLRLRMIRSKRKWGNNDPAVNALGADIIECFASQINGKPNSRGGVFLAAGRSDGQCAALGARTGATPDGRRAADGLSGNLSPSKDAATEGATALVSTLSSAVDITRLPAGCLLDVALHSSSCESERGLALMRSLVGVFFRNGGGAVKFTVFGDEILKAAQVHPEGYGNIQVRIGGWEARWGDMARGEQDAFIRRSGIAMV